MIHRGVPLAVRLGERQRRDGLTRGDAREELTLLVIGGGVHDRVRGEAHRREVRGAEQDPTQLLDDDAELDEAEALPSVRLRQVQALEPELLRHL